MNWDDDETNASEHDFNDFNYSSLFGTPCNDSLDRPRVSKLQNYDLFSSHGPK